MEGTGRVGLLADVGAVHAAGGVATAVVTALTAQGRRFEMASVPGRLLVAQLDAALAFSRPSAVKLGLVPDARTLGLLVPRLRALGVPWVVDPVVRTSHGEQLSRLGPRDFRRLGATPGVWLTPNVPELAWLLGRRTLPRSVEEVTELATALLEEGFAAVVVKGGHQRGPPTDVLVSAVLQVHLAGSRLPRREKRGTGCRFASTLATRLALGWDSVRAARDAKRAVRRYLAG